MQILNDRVKNLKSGGGGGTGGADQEELDKCKQDLENLRQEFEKHRDQALRNLNQLNNEMPNKADKKDLMELEDRLMQKLSELIQEMLGKFADKDETNARIKKCVAKIKELFDLVGNKKVDD